MCVVSFLKGIYGVLTVDPVAFFFFTFFLLCLISCIAGASVYPADFPSMYRHLEKHQAATPLPRLSPADDITT